MKVPFGVLRKSFDLSVYFVADPDLCAGRALLDVAKDALDGGVTLLQLRNKSGEVAGIKAQAVGLKKLANTYGVSLLINDYVEIAKEINADGVHLGQGDMKPEQARALLGPDKIIGQTSFMPEHMEAIDPLIVDYAGTGPFFATKTEKGKPVLGAPQFKELLNMSRVPVVGIGGITPENAHEVIKSGGSGVAMMRAISSAPNPKQAAQLFVMAVRKARLGCAA